MEQKARSDAFNFGDVWVRMAKKKYDAVWDLVWARVQELPLGATTVAADEKDSKAASSTLDESVQVSAMNYLEGVLVLVHEFLEDESRKAPLALFQLLQLLQSTSPDLPCSPLSLSLNALSQPSQVFSIPPSAACAPPPTPPLQ
jgi:hypothetical protein